VARPRNPLLNRERIVGAALALVDAEGLAALSTRRLAAELGVSGPSLYNHFATKDALLDAVVDHVVGEVDLSMWEASRGPEAPGVVFGSALGSFAAGFVDDQQVYSEDYPRLGEAHLLADRRRQVDEGAFETGLAALVEGLAAQYGRLAGPGGGC